MTTTTRLACLAALLLVVAPATAQSRPADGGSSSPSGALNPASSSSPQSDAVLRDSGIGTYEEFRDRLNSHNTVQGSESIKSYRILFDAMLDMTELPAAVGDDLHQDIIHPKMANWSAVSGWAESNGHVAQAILDSRDKMIVGLPYGVESVPEEYNNAGFRVDLVRDGGIGHINFDYFRALDKLAAFATAEAYRRFEAGQAEQALDLALAHIFVLRQFCDRDFLAEKAHSINLLTGALSNLRDMFYVYMEKIEPDRFRDISIRDIPFLRPDRGRLLMPEADRLLAEVRLDAVYDRAIGAADPEAFSEIFSEIQSADEPLTAFGARRRWRMIAVIHGSHPAARERLNLIYDDWWRRWRIQAFDPILSVPTEFDRCNPIRYAAVLYSMEDIASLFSIRDRLIAEVNATAMAAGICGHKQTFPDYPRGTQMVYSSFARKRNDVDPFDRTGETFKYRVISNRHSIDTLAGRLWVEPGVGLLYGRGEDHDDDRGDQHSDDGTDGDIVFWPPIKALQREQGLID